MVDLHDHKRLDYELERYREHYMRSPKCPDCNRVKMDTICYDCVVKMEQNEQELVRLKQKHPELFPKPADKGICGWFLTFTLSPNKSKELMPVEIYDVLTRSTIHFIAGAVEHPNSNIHVHLYVTTEDMRLQPKNFKKYISRVGAVNVRKVKRDHGIEDYLRKENYFDDIDTLVNFLQDACKT